MQPTTLFGSDAELAYRRERLTNDVRSHRRTDSRLRLHLPIGRSRQSAHDANVDGRD